MTHYVQPAEQVRSGPIRILELRCADGAGGGPEKTILKGAAESDPAHFDLAVCYLRSARDRSTDILRRAAALGVNYTEVPQLRAFDSHAWKKVRSIVAARRIDIVHAHDYKSNLIALWLAKKERCLPLSTAHGWTGHTLRERWLYYPAERRFLLRRFPRIIAVSGEIRDSLVQAGVPTDRISIILNGIDEKLCRRRAELVAAARQRQNATDDSFLVGSVGRLEPQKRFDLLLHAFASALACNSRLRLVIAGEGSQRSQLEGLIAHLGLINHCQLLGHCTDVESFYHSLDLFVQSSEYEGTPNVVLEAMAYEVPVVATAAGGTEEILRNRIDGWIVPLRDKQRLTMAIIEASQNPRDAFVRAKSARSRVENTLSFRERTRRVEAVYRNLVLDHGGRNLLRVSSAVGLK